MDTKKVKNSAHFVLKNRLLWLSLLGLLSTGALTSCGSGIEKPMQTNMPGAPAGGTAQQAAENMAAVPQADTAVGATETPRTLPQLIKKGSLNVVVNSIDKSLKEVSSLVAKQQGDLMGLQDNKPKDPSVRRKATIQIRVPQNKLETTLDQLAKLGNVQNKSITAEDVSQQLVDIDARVRNLRKSEEMTLKIMDRSGSVGDILKVSQQLNTIRSDIERLDAQQKTLRNQVAFSSIALTLEAAVSATPESQPSVGIRMQETWGKATHSVGEFTQALLALMLWLLAFSPYFVLAGAVFYGVKKWKKNKSLPPASRPDAGYDP
ncbi:DUF4349 domain-containing protein [Ancylothrix sp. C2]|uniref:DUF4349 domain-containing protein n=1 Tax=Ancylothrix sp. D3o TaxID=2953691 RepID=UPI0021BB866C|nr:DUF4349 domain-containing protein [Ancylothrix sp. D3o]MCT7948932.1 DUF4349 domain-containing protein [Ancylothrix sp. D3o]